MNRIYCVVIMVMVVVLAGANDDDYRYGNASAHLFRFRDFEPRPQTTHGKRESRGFHFHSSDEDIAVDLEFIVPFVKVPVSRSLSLAREAVQSILNLRTGALLNTAIVVAAGSIIAAVVRLLLAPLIFTSFGYRTQRDKDSTTRRSFRSLKSVVESQLDANNIDMSACAQRYICQYLQENAATLRSQRALTGLSSSPARFIDAVINLQWVNAHLNGTAVYRAIDAARGTHNCGYIFPRCGLSLHWIHSLPNIFQQFNGG